MIKLATWSLISRGKSWSAQPCQGGPPVK
jgi:hypothetical protein